MYRSIPIWRRLSEDKAVRYSCFEDLETGEFCVQSADFFALPIEANMLAYADVQFVELFIEEDPRERCEWFVSIEDAILGHIKKFS